jgi:uncharacterized protein (DUF2267 family)/CBS domain-containing protein
LFPSSGEHAGNQLDAYSFRHQWLSACKSVEVNMSVNGLGTFDRSIHASNLWLKEISKEIGADRRVAWRALGVVLRVLRDRLTVDDAAHLAAQLPLLIRGAFYEQYRPVIQPESIRSREEFIARVAGGLGSGGRPVSPERAVRAVLSTIQRHIAEAETAKVRHALPEDIRKLWPANADARPLKHGDGSMKVADVMSRNVRLASPDDTLQEIAKRMTAEDVGFLPVGENDRLVGMITDRDIVARAVALGRDGQSSRVRDAMTEDVKYCFEDDTVDSAMQNMSDIQVRRLPVVNRNKRLVGIVSLADAAMKYDPAAAGAAMCGVTEPGAPQPMSAFA